MREQQLSHRRAALLLGLASLCQAGLSTPARAAGGDASQALVEAADKIRNPGQAFRVTARVVEYRDGRPHDSSTLQVYAKPAGQSGQYRNLASYQAPAADLGKAILMQDKIMWFYDPASAASVRVSPQQRLVGQASVSDVMTVNLTNDYTATQVGEESINDADNKPRQTVRLSLAAAADSAIYLRIDYWLEKGTGFPVKQRFYADSGRPLKVAYFRKPSQQLGALRPTEVIILDEVDTSVLTRLSFSDFRAMDIPDRWFQRDYLSHLQAAP